MRFSLWRSICVRVGVAARSWAWRLLRFLRPALRGVVEGVRRRLCRRSARFGMQRAFARAWFLTYNKLLKLGKREGVWGGEKPNPQQNEGVTVKGWVFLHRFSPGYPQSYPHRGPVVLLSRAARSEQPTVPARAIEQGVRGRGLRRQSRLHRFGEYGQQRWCGACSDRPTIPGPWA